MTATFTSKCCAFPSPAHGIMTLWRGRIFDVVDYSVVEMESRAELSKCDGTEITAQNRDIALRRTCIESGPRPWFGRKDDIFFLCFWLHLQRRLQRKGGGSAMCKLRIRYRSHALLRAREVHARSGTCACLLSRPNHFVGLTP